LPINRINFMADVAPTTQRITLPVPIPKVDANETERG